MLKKLIGESGLQVIVLIFSAGFLSVKAANVEVISRPWTNAARSFGLSSDIQLNANGQWAVFNSSAMGLTTNQRSALSVDVFLRNITSGETILVSRTPDARGGNRSSLAASLSRDGRFVLFQSDADDLVKGDTNRTTDVFLFDRDSNSVRLISRSGDGVANGTSVFATMTSDAGFILFESEATNLVAVTTRRERHLYRYEHATERLNLVTTDYTGTRPAEWLVHRDWRERSTISDDGRYVAFLAAAQNLVEFPGADVNNPQVYLRDMTLGTNWLISMQSPGIAGNNVSSPIVSRDGKVVIFTSANLSTNREDARTYLYSYAIPSAELTPIPFPDAQLSGLDPKQIEQFALSGNGQKIAYTLAATGAAGIPRDQVFVYDVALGTNRCISINTNGVPANGVSRNPAISEDGRRILFTSDATDLTPYATAGFSQLYRFDLVDGRSRPPEPKC